MHHYASLCLYLRKRSITYKHHVTTLSYYHIGYYLCRHLHISHLGLNLQIMVALVEYADYSFCHRANTLCYNYSKGRQKTPVVSHSGDFVGD